MSYVTNDRGVQEYTKDFYHGGNRCIQHSVIKFQMHWAIIMIEKLYKQ